MNQTGKETLIIELLIKMMIGALTAKGLRNQALKGAARPFGKIIGDKCGEGSKIAYQEEVTKHRSKLPLYDLEPISENAWIAPNSTIGKRGLNNSGIVGEVLLKRFVSVWYNCVIRGDINRVMYFHLLIIPHSINHYSSIGDKTVIHTAASLPTGMSSEVFIGHNVTVHNGCTLYSCHIEDDVVIGAKSVILEGARLEKGCMIAPGSVVPPGRLIPAKTLWAGNPVEYVKDLDIGEAFANYSLSYVNVALGDIHKNEFTIWPSNYLKMPSNREDLEFAEEEVEPAYCGRSEWSGKVKHFS